MKSMVILPSWKPDDIYPAKLARSAVSYQHPLGLLYIATCVQEAGHEVELVDGAFWTHQEVLDKVRRFRPRFVGVSANASMWTKAIKTAAGIKAIDPAIHVSAAGPYPSAVEEKCLVDCPDFDSAVIGEGEKTMPELLSRLEANAGLEGVAGTAFRRDDGRVHLNEPRPLIEDLDSIPIPRRELLGDFDKYESPPGSYRRKPIAIVMTSRGCKARCIYCFQMKGEHRIRFRSVDNVVREVKELVTDYGFREIRFLDETFTADRERAMELCRRFRDIKPDFSFYVSSRVNTVDFELLREMKRAGCWAILFGAESGVQKNLNTLRKGITLDQTRAAVAAAKKAGLKVYTPFIIGIPGETYEEALETVDFAIELDPHYANFHTMTPFPGTELYDNVEKYGVMSSNTDDYTFEGAAFVPFSMTREEIEQVRTLAFRKFYSRPGFIFKRIFEIRSVHDLKTVSKGAASFFWLWTQRNAASAKSGIPGKKTG
ncbi:MAG: B12-binding domain-containing radical SAM protein [Actinobacteria bacterium]|nr:B12-binding domain-containing radical SAM protein [Actinomycetota bacterium]